VYEKGAAKKITFLAMTMSQRMIILIGKLMPLAVLQMSIAVGAAGILSL